MVAITDEAELRQYLSRPHKGDFILEQCVSGEICSVEVLGARGTYVVQPVVWQGPAETGPVFDFGRPRYATPCPGHDEAFAPVAEKLRELCRGLDLEGAVGIDPIYADGRCRILEINPRVAGTTTPCIAASGLNTYDCLLSILDGSRPATPVPAVAPGRRVCLQFPIHDPTPAFLRDVTRELGVVRTQTLTIDGVRHPDIVITCELDDRDALPA
ncbi:ATP-grasp domain-containing protein [Streptomyces misionensis]|uniref:ATP-grasp domain-containing protein n=1 Tax=Streptomyces misionensis TaxID=67331 RepID=UPI0021BD299D|nr:ATP-grasp domain-containing protein [Streptomyces misionensis]